MSQKNPATDISRRNLLSLTSAVTAAAVLPAGCGKPKTEPAPAVKTAPLTRQERLKTPLPKPNGLNVVVIIADTFRADHVGAFGSKRTKTPNLDHLASEGVLFENVYADGLPTIPCRRVLHAGRSLLKEKTRWWRPMDEEDVTLAEILKKADFHTGFIVDTYHHFKAGMNFHRGFDTFQWIRGQETDAWINGSADNLDLTKYMPAHLVNDRYRQKLGQFIRNTSMRKSEKDYFCAQSCRAAAQWLERQKPYKPFFLWIDMFDPHEPWDAPPRFKKMYRDDYGYKRYLFGYGVRHEDIRESDYPFLRDLYSAEVTFSDHWVGWLIDRIDKLGMRDDTIIVFSTDHGTHLGELGCFQKTPGLLNSCVAHIPLIVRHPDTGYAGKHVSGLMSHLDYMPTLLSLVGIPEFPGVEGINAWTMADGGDPIRERTFTGFGNFAAVRDNKWHYFQNFRGKDPGKGPALYDLDADPGEKTNVADKYPDVVAERKGWIAKRFDATLPVPRTT